LIRKRAKGALFGNIDLRPVGNKNSLSKTAMALLCDMRGARVVWSVGWVSAAPLSSFQLYLLYTDISPLLFISKPSFLSGGARLY